MCTRKQYNFTEENELNVEAELIWGKVTIPNRRPIYVCSFYRPPDNNPNPILQLQLSLSKLVTQHSINFTHTVGNFNFPIIQWSDGHGLLSTNPTYGSELNNLFLTTINNIGLEQFVNTPTRLNNILDLQ